MQHLHTFLFLIVMGKSFAIDGETWPTAPLQWPLFSSQIFNQNEPGEPSKLTLDQAIKNSIHFPIRFPENSTRWAELEPKVDRKILASDINQAYPLIHEQALSLFIGFLQQKRRFGNTAERDFYQNMSLPQLIDRLLIKRAVVFKGVDDEYSLLDGFTGKGGWETIASDAQKPPLILQNCLSYDEIKLSALLSVSSPSFFIDKDGGVKGRGVVFGAVGARLEKPLVMEYREIMKTKQQNHHGNGYGQFFVPTMQGVFTNFWGDISATFDELEMRKAFEEGGRYVKIDEDKYFDKWVYARRIALAVDTLLVETNDRASQLKKNASLHVVGLGLNEWRITPEQDKIFVETFLDRMKFLGLRLKTLEKVCFYQFNTCTPEAKVKLEEHPLGGIEIEACDSLIQEKMNDEGKLVVVSYNWNGNSLPGNEFWLHNFTSISDGAVMATLSQISEIQNPQINTNIRSSNLRVVTLSGLYTFQEYLKLNKKDE